MNEVGVVGDIHGHADPLERLLGGLEGVVRQLVFLGDYVNRGPDSARVIDLLVALGERVPCVFLEGNHDAAFRRALRGEFDAFLAMGGAATIRSYVSPPYVDVERELTEAIPLSHRSFLHNLVPSYETAEIVVGHVLPVGVP